MLLLSYSWVITKICHGFQKTEKEPHLAKHKNACKGCHYLHTETYICVYYINIFLGLYVQVLYICMHPL